LRYNDLAPKRALGTCFALPPGGDLRLESEISVIPLSLENDMLRNTRKGFTL